MVKSFQEIELKYKNQREKIRSQYIKPEKKSLEGNLKESKQKEKAEKKELAKQKLAGIKTSLGKTFNSKGQRTFFKKPSIKIPRVDPRKAVTQDAGRYSLVKEGRTGYFNRELMEEANWLN